MLTFDSRSIIIVSVAWIFCKMKTMYEIFYKFRRRVVVVTKRRQCMVFYTYANIQPFSKSQGYNGTTKELKTRTLNICRDDVKLNFPLRCISHVFFFLRLV